MGDFGVIHASRLTAQGQGTTSVPGTLITASATVNVDGAVAQLVAATAHDADGFILQYGQISAVGMILLDLLIGASTTERELLGDLYIGSGAGRRMLSGVYVPQSIPNGSRLSARCRAGVASLTCRIGLILIKHGFPRLPNFDRATTYGSTPGSSRGVTLNPGAVADVKSAWGVLSTSTTFPIQWAVFMASRANDATVTSQDWRIDIGIGAAASERVIVPDLAVTVDGSGDPGGIPHCFSFPLWVPPGSRLVARAASTLATDAENDIDVVLIGLD